MQTINQIEIDQNDLRPSFVELDGKELFTGTYSQCVKFILDSQPKSASMNIFPQTEKH